MLIHPVHTNEAPAAGDERGAEGEGVEGMPTPAEQEVHAAFRTFVLAQEFPCVAAKAAVHQGEYRLALYAELGVPETTAGLAHDLTAFLREAETGKHDFLSFVAIFQQPRDSTETEFERCLWEQLGSLNHQDAKTFSWDERVSSDPEDPHFSFSFAGEAFYIVGLHARASRQARRFGWPALVFNLHAQFEKLRGQGKYERVQHTIRTRDEKLQGSINPMLGNFGDYSEARQYSGRAVGEGWHAPFHAESGPAAQCPFHRL